MDRIYAYGVLFTLGLLLVLIFVQRYIIEWSGIYERFVAPYVPSLPGWGPEWSWRWYQWSPWRRWGYPVSYALYPKRRRGMGYDIRGDPYIQPRVVSPWYNPSVLPIRNRPLVLY